MGKITDKRENKKKSDKTKKTVLGRIEIFLIALCVAGCILTGIAAGRRISHNKKLQEFHTKLEQLHERIENRKQNPVAFVQSAEWPENGYTFEIDALTGEFLKWEAEDRRIH